MSVLRRGTAARAAPTVKGLSSAGVKRVMNCGRTGAAARLWVRRVGPRLGGLNRQKPGVPKLRDLLRSGFIFLQVAIWAPSGSPATGFGLERILVF